MLSGYVWPRSGVRVRLFCLLAGLSLACSDAVPVGPSLPTAQIGGAAQFSLLPLELFGINPTGGPPCSSAPYRQFDFWVGNWDVYRGSSTNLAGTNQVKSLLNGCAVEENWIGAFGGTGRSLNTYDQASDRWSQMWVAPDGCPFSVILIEGGFVDGAMTMRGRREQPAGFLIAPPCGPPPPTVVFARSNLIRWTPLASGSVLQQLTVANNDDPLPEPQPAETLAGLRYDPVEQVTELVPRVPGSFCPFRAGAQQFNFMIGTWAVHQGEGNGVQGSVTFSKDQSSCLVLEHFSALGGYEGISFNTFDVFTQRWVRTYVDNQGQRLMLTGGRSGSDMVLEGTKQRKAGAPVNIRLTWSPVAADEVVQTWEFSLDGGETWLLQKSLRYTRQS